MNELIMAGNYELLSELGQGGYGKVYLCKQLSTGQQVALKCIKNDHFKTGKKSNKVIARFEREIKICSKMNHPNIVKVLDKGYLKTGDPFAVFEYVSGVTLKELISDKKQLGFPVYKEIMEQVLSALVCSHEKGIIHRDLKPQNIMVYESGGKYHAKILDFGIGTFIPNYSSIDYTQFTMTQDVIGTPKYCSPEQLRGEALTTNSDLYSWGLVLLECITGTSVMKGNTIAEVFQQQLIGSNIPLPSSLVEHELGNILRRVLEKNPVKRASVTQKVLNEFMQVNPSTIVGEIKDHGVHAFDDENTDVNVGFSMSSVVKKQISALSLRLNIVQPSDRSVDLEIIEAIHKDQLNLLEDKLVKYGGYLVPSFMNQLLVYFGYPEASDTSVRRAGKTAVEIVSEVERRNEILLETNGLSFDVRLVVHTGTMLIKDHLQPEGQVANVSLELLNHCQTNSILISNDSFKLLDPFFELREVGDIKLAGGMNFRTHYLMKMKDSSVLIKKEDEVEEIIGRDIEHKIFKELWAQETFRSKSLCVYGDAGIGKTKLIKGWAQELLSQGIFVREVHCLTELQNNALFPFLGLLEKELGLQKDQRNAIDHLRSFLMTIDKEPKVYLPILCSWLHVSLEVEKEEVQVAPEKQKSLILEVIVAFLNQLGVKNPFLLIVEDLHWSDPTTLELIQKLISLEDKNFFLLLSSRHKESICEEAEQVQSCQINSFSFAETRLFVEQLLDHNKIDDEVVEYISDKSDGVALFIEELTYMMLESDLLILDQGYSLSHQITEIDVPVTVKGLLQARLNSLSFEKSCIEYAAIIGRDFGKEILLEATRQEEKVLEVQLNELIGAHLITKQKDREEYSFRHALVRDAVYESMSTHLKKERHGDVAQILDELPIEYKKGRQFEIARHYSLNENYPPALRLGKEAAKLSLDKSLNKEVLNIVAQVNTWGKEQHESVDYILSLQCIEINALMSLKGWASEEVKHLSSIAFEQLKITNLSKVRKSTITEIYWALITYYHIASERDQMRELTIQFKDLSEKEMDNDMLISASILEGIYLYTEGFNVDAIKTLEDVYVNISKNNNHNLTIGVDNEVYVLAYLSQLYWQEGDKLKGRELGDLAISQARVLNLVPSLCLALFYRTAIYCFDGDKKSTCDMAEELLLLSNEYGLVAYYAYGSTLYHWAKDEVDSIDIIVEQLEGIGCKLGLTLYKSLPAEYEFYQGNVEHALTRLGNCLELCDQNQEFFFHKNLKNLKEKLEQESNQINK